MTGVCTRGIVLRWVLGGPGRSFDFDAPERRRVWWRRMGSHPLRAKALRRWASSDPVIHALAKRTPAPARGQVDGSPFEALVQSIAHQQVSLAAGQTIFGRVRALGSTPKMLLKAGPAALRAAGLSRPKVAYVLDLAQKAVAGEVDFAHIATMDDGEVIEQLTAVKGIGVWTAKMFLLFHLGRPDVLPFEDLGLQVAVARSYGVPRKRAAKKIIELGELWSPYSSYASLVLWNARRVEMGAKPR